MTEADTCTRYVVPKLREAGWDNDPHSFREQHTFTDGRIVLAGDRTRRRPQKRADYLLAYTRDFTIAVVEAKPEDAPAGEGLQQAKEYAEILGLPFAYATNGHAIVEFDYLAGAERELTAFPSPGELWARLRGGRPIAAGAERALLEPYNQSGGKNPRYYQQIAINRTIEAVLRGQRRVLVTMATGTGKTVVAFQVCWKLWSARWNKDGAYRRPKILFLADRNILVDDPKDKTFAPFGDARWKIEGGRANQGREMYFATYQSLARDERRPGLYREYAPDFFDLIVVDECHRGSASDDGNWREILEYFSPAYQFGMTATPRREENADTYDYFGGAVYTYSLRQGIEDGFLAPYRVHRVVTSWDAAGWRPSQGDVDRFGRAIPDEVYGTKDFERVVALRKRTEAIARNLTDHLKATDRFAKTIVFCTDQEHADEMRRALINLNSDLVRQHPDYAARVTADEGDVGRLYLSNFQDLERPTPVILTTSQLLTTGVDAPTCKNVVLARVIGSMTEFKQIIGRGTRVREDYGKLYFTIVDYTGSATRLFADPAFDGDPSSVTQSEMDDEGNTTGGDAGDEEDAGGPDEPTETGDGDESSGDGDRGGEGGDGDGGRGGRDGRREKFYFDGGRVEIDTHLVYELDADGRQLRCVKFTDYATEKVRTLYASADELRSKWSDPEQRRAVVDALLERGIDFDRLAADAGRPDADPFDLLCHLAYDAPLRTRRERAERLRREQADFFDRYGPRAREVLRALLDKYEQHGTAEFVLPDALRVPPLSAYGNVMEIAGLFGGAEQLLAAVTELQTNLYAA